MSVSLCVPADAVASLPLEQRMTLLDAESEMLAAQDARDAQDEAVASASDAIGRAERRLDEARKAGDKKAEAANGPDVAKAGVTEAEARLKFAEQDRELARARLATQEALLLLAQARFEMSRAREVDTVGQAGRYGVKVPDYQGQVDRITAYVKTMTDEEAKVKAHTDELHKTWDIAAQDLAQMTGGAQGSIWVQ